ncbi:hypothetical protein [Alexandriicola marinus]|nr:hypothetical protein [Alexandriicola marinus]
MKDGILRGTPDDALAILAGFDLGGLLAELPETGAVQTARN